MAAASAAVAGGLAGAGSLLLLAALVPYLPLGPNLASVPPGDVRHAPLVGAGVLLLLAAGAVAAWTRHRWPRAAGPRQAALLAAAAVPLAVGLFVAVRSGPTLWTADPTPPLDRLLLVGSAGATIAAPFATLVMLRPVVGLRTLVLERRMEVLLLAAVLAVFAGTVALGIAQDVPFAWDEAVYALTTRHWLFGTPDTGWGIHRPPVISALGVVPMLIGSDEALFRIIGLLFGVGVVAATWFLARGVAGPVAGVLAAAGVAAAPSIQIDAGLFLNDVPAMAVLLLLMGIAWRLLTARGPIGWTILWLAPLAAAAFYLRYGSILPLGAIGLTALLLFPGRLLQAWPKVLATAGLLILLLIPHSAFAVAQTGSPLGVFFRAQSGAAGAYLGAGLVQYLAWLPSALIGIVPAAVAVIGLAGAVHRLVLAGLGRRDANPRAIWFCVTPALLLIGVLGLFQLPQGRYLFLPMTLLVIAGSMVIGDVIREPGRIGRWVAVGTAAALLLGLAATAVDMPRRAEGRAAVYEWLREAGTWIREASDGSCSILASDVPQLTWYSGCPTYSFADTSRANRDRLLTGSHRYLVVRRDGRFQPSGEVLAAYLARVEPEPVAAFHNRDGSRRASVFRFVQ